MTSQSRKLAEVLDGIPIFARRVKLKMGVSIAVLAVALGKIVGSLVYFNGKMIYHIYTGYKI